MFQVSNEEKKYKKFVTYVPVDFGKKNNVLEQKSEMNLSIKGESNNINSVKSKRENENKELMGGKKIKKEKEDTTEEKKREITLLMGKKRERLEKIVKKETQQKRKKIFETIKERQEKITNLESQMQAIQREMEAIKMEVEALQRSYQNLEAEEKAKLIELNDNISFQQINLLCEIDEKEKIKEIVGEEE